MGCKGLDSKIGANIDDTVVRWKMRMCNNIVKYNTSCVTSTVRCFTALQSPQLTWHADAGELASSINTGPLVHTRVAVTLINIHLAPWSSVSLQQEDHCQHVHHAPHHLTCGHLHVYDPGVLTHCPSCSQGVATPAHSSISSSQVVPV